MALLPTAAHVGDDARVKSETKIDLVAIRDVAAQIGGSERWSSDKTLTIASGVVTPTMNLHLIETEGGAASDILTTIAITNFCQGMFVRIGMATPGHAIVVQHLNAGASGQMYLATDANFTIDYIDKFVDFVLNGTNWIEVNRCWGADKASLEFRTYQGHGTAAAVDYGTSANQILRLNSSAQIPAVSGALVTGIERRGQYILVEDQKTAMTDGGASVADTYWHQRDLNTKVIDETVGAVVTVSSNRANLPAGTYYFRASAPCYSSSSHKIYVRQSTGAAIFYGPSGMMTEVYGTNAYCTTAVQTDSLVAGKFILAAPGSIEIWYRCTASQPTNGLGIHHGAGTSIYSRIEFWRVP